MRSQQGWLDGVAIAASAACLVHCLLLPMLLAALPALSAVLDIPESFHRYAVTFAVPTSALTLVAGRRRHGGDLPMALGAMGLAIMAAAAFIVQLASFETPLTVCGSLSVASAHVLNWRSGPGRIAPAGNTL